MTASSPPSRGTDMFREVPPDRTSGDGLAVELLRLALALLALAILIQAALGFVGALGAAPAVVAIAWVGLLVGAFAIARRRESPAAATPWSAADCAGAAALAAALGERCWAGLHRTTFLYDVLSYHLHLPATWRSLGRITLVPTPFGDPGTTYAPANAELLFHLALGSTGNARLAHVGQLPFAALAALAIYATARSSAVAAARGAGFAGALAFLLIPEVWQQAPTAMADLATAAFFLAGLPFLLRLRRPQPWRQARLDVAALGLALGLLLGTKYIAVVLVVPLLVWTAATLLAPAPRWRVGGAAIGAASRESRDFRDRRGDARIRACLVIVALALSCGGFWYVRNVLTTGNPLFPATLRFGSWTIAPGLLDGAALRSSEYHLPISHLGGLLEIVCEIGWAFLGGCGIILGFGVAAVIRTPGAARYPWGWLGLAAAVLALMWLVVPFQESRFFFSAWGVLAIFMAAATARSARAGLLALAAAAVGSILQFPTAGRLALVGAATLGAAAGPAVIRRVLPHVGRWSLTVLMTVLLVPVATLIVWAAAHPHPAAPYIVGDTHDEAWAWMGARTEAHFRDRGVGLRVAYAGSNLPLPLWGPRFENQVRYVSVSGGTDPAAAAPHNFLHVPPSVATRVTSEPAPERHAPNQARWLANLGAFDADVLFVTTMYPSVRRTIAHDAAGFPIERVWADAHPEFFSLSFANEGVRIYTFQSDGRP